MAVQPGSGDSGTHRTHGGMMGTAKPDQSLFEEEMLGLGPWEFARWVWEALEAGDSSTCKLEVEAWLSLNLVGVSWG